MGIRQEHRSNLMMKGQVDAANNSTYLSPEAEADRIACMAIPGRRAFEGGTGPLCPFGLARPRNYDGRRGWWLQRQPYVAFINAATARLSITLRDSQQAAARLEIDLSQNMIGFLNEELLLAAAQILMTT